MTIKMFGAFCPVIFARQAGERAGAMDALELLNVVQRKSNALGWQTYCHFGRIFVYDAEKRVEFEILDGAIRKVGEDTPYIDGEDEKALDEYLKKVLV